MAIQISRKGELHYGAKLTFSYNLYDGTHAKVDSTTYSLDNQKRHIYMTWNTFCYVLFARFHLVIRNKRPYNFQN